MGKRSLFNFSFIRSPDVAFPANRSPRSSSASSFESSALPFPFPPQESDAESPASRNESFYPFSIDQIFAPARSVANSSSFSESASLSLIDPDALESHGGSEHLERLTSQKDGPTATINAVTFTFRELAAATKNFRSEYLLGEGGSVLVYKGRLMSTGQVVAVKKLKRDGLQGNREFLVEVLMLSLLNHPNIINFFGYCAEGDQRLIVYEYMPLGSLNDHLFDLSPGREPLNWNTRLKIAVGIAKGLEFLHDKANPPVIHGDISSSNILLDDGYHPKLSNFGLAKLGPVSNKTFGVVLLELITGRRAIDITRPQGEQHLILWARPLFGDRRKFTKIVDPSLQGRYPMRGLYQAIAVAAMCLQEQAEVRPAIGDVVTALTYVASQKYDSNTTSSQKTQE